MNLKEDEFQKILRAIWNEARSPTPDERPEVLAQHEESRLEARNALLEFLEKSGKARR